ncbi:uncharacterized protein G2W53_019761 [Senna tora]|uniref:Uncharacterized protein n=1 Tax=Senna tora TaxID=362788 RepID=A0A834TWM3_9FABA|nr:uncharacterized protein G2W53_019761 [Senna tora]
MGWEETRIGDKLSKKREILNLIKQAKHTLLNVDSKVGAIN